MHEYREYWAKDNSSDEPVRAYKVEEPHEVNTIGGTRQVGDGYVVQRDRPELVDHVSADAFEDAYSERQPSDVNADNADDADLPGEANDLPDENDTDEGYDPTQHTVAEVVDYVRNNPDQREYVLARERAASSRSGVLNA